MAFSKLDLLGLRGSPVVLADIEFAGRTWYFATRDVTVDGVDYAGVIEDWPDIVQEIPQRPNDRTPEAAVSMRIMWPEDVALLAKLGNRLASATASVYVWFPGLSKDSADCIVRDARSQTFSPEYGSPCQSVGLTFSVRSTSETWPPDSWTDPIEGADRRLPWVFGAAIDSRIPTTPTATSSANSFVLHSGPADFPYDGPVSGAVTVVNRSKNSSEVCDVTYQTLPARDTLAVIAAVQTPNATWEPTDEYYYSPDGSGDFTATGIYTAGDLAQFLLEKLNSDMVSSAKAIETLRRYPISGYFDEPSDPLDLLVDHIVQVFPVSLCHGCDGYYLQDYSDQDPVDTVHAGSEFDRDSLVSEEGDIVNNVSLTFRDFLGTPLRTAIAGQQTELGGFLEDTLTVRIPEAVESADLFGLSAQTLESDIVSDGGTAVSLAIEYARQHAYPGRLVEYLNPGHSKAWWAPGQIVTLHDEELYWTPATARILQKQYRPDCTAFLLDILDQGEPSLQDYSDREVPVQPPEPPVVPTVVLSGGDLTWPNPIPPGYSA